MPTLNSNTIILYQQIPTPRTKNFSAKRSHYLVNGSCTTAPRCPPSVMIKRFKASDVKFKPRLPPPPRGTPAQNCAKMSKLSRARWSEWEKIAKITGSCWRGYTRTWADLGDWWEVPAASKSSEQAKEKKGLKLVTKRWWQTPGRFRMLPQVTFSLRLIIVIVGSGQPHR